jgi:SAM-dependent methyltransferase
VLRAWNGGNWLLKRLRPFVPRNGHVFEVGAGIGCTVKAFERAGYQASGIEPGVGFSRFAQRAFGACVTRASLFDMPPQPAYDFILLVHVIEHFNSPRRALEYIHSMLRPGGRLFIECPNVAAPHAAPGKLFHTAHIYNFTPDTLVALAESCGFLFNARLSQPNCREIRLVFQRGPVCELRIPEQSYDQTLSRLRRYSPMSYHLRTGYVLHRIIRDVRMGSNRIMARSRLQRLLRECSAASPQPLRRAA